MELRPSKKINQNPLVCCIKKTALLCDENKKHLYKELSIPGAFSPKYVFNSDVVLPSQEDEIRSLFAKVLPYNEPGITALLEEYRKIKR